MKHILFLLVFLLPLCCRAGLDEVVLHSQDQKCAIHYLTQSPLKEQTIQTNNKCPDGWVQGHASVEINTPSAQTKETLTGFFMDGYWLGSFPARGHVQDRSNPQENVQALTFILNTGQPDDITYLAQLRATRSENRIYSAFEGCPIFRLLVITPNIRLFQNEAFQEKIATQALTYAKRLCTDLEAIAIFGTKKINARSHDIIFQMQIDPDTNERTLIPIQNDFQNTDINEPIELRQQSGKVLLSVEPQKDDLIIHYGETKTPSFPESTETSATPITSLNHMIVQSKITNQPVQGRVIVHIQNLNLDGSAWVDSPQRILLKYHPHLKIGWAIVQGRFDDNQMQVSDIQFCQQEWCADVP